MKHQLTGEGGKGSKFREVDKNKFDSNFDRIFGKKEKPETKEHFLLITGCKDSLRWYAGLIGQKVVNLGYVGNGEYRSRQPDGYINFVQAEDCETV